MRDLCKAPGEDDLAHMYRFRSPSDSVLARSDSLLVKGRGGDPGGAIRKAREEREQAEAGGEPYEFPTEAAEPSEEKPKEEPAVLSNPKWSTPDTLFHQEVEVSVEVTLPPGKEMLTRVQAELIARLPSGEDSIWKGEGHAKPDGTAVVTLPVYKPNGYQGGPVEYFVRFTHKLAKILNAENMLRSVSETALRSLDHILIPGRSFPKDSSFIGPNAAPGLRSLESKFMEWDAKYPKKVRLAAFGHAEKDEKDPKALSERRAQSAFAFISNDAETWEKLYGKEKWGLKPLQILLKDLGHYTGTPDGLDGPRTQTAFKALQKKSGLPETGKEDPGTRKALFGAYMQGKHDIRIETSRFCRVDGYPWMGCGTTNRIQDGEAPTTANRRVAFVLFHNSRFFPIYFPCKDGNPVACDAQCKRVGKRSAPGIRCLFHDEMLREADQAKTASSQETTADSAKAVGSYSVEKAVAHLDANAHDKSQGRCARYVRLAIEAGGMKIPPPNPVSAKDYGPKLEEMRFKKIDATGYAPQKGDIAVFQAPSTSPHGHIQMFNGTIWVSDFRQDDQKDIYPGSRYREEKISYEIFRP